jgi:hypothetical protein
VYGKTDGRANQENKYEFPPPIDNTLFFGNCIILNRVGDIVSDLTETEWTAIYDKLYGGFEDLNSEDDSESDDDDGLPRTKSGYVKDGFIVEDDDDDEITEGDLRTALKDVRDKKAIFKMQHKMKINLRARSKNKKLEDLEEHLEKKGINANIDSLRQRIKKRKTIGQLESNQDKLRDKALDDNEESMDVDQGRGRKRKRSVSMSDDEESKRGDSKKTVGSKRTVGSNKNRSMTPVQLKIQSQSKLRSMSKGRREGSVPQPRYA